MRNQKLIVIKYLITGLFTLIYLIVSGGNEDNTFYLLAQENVTKPQCNKTWKFIADNLTIDIADYGNRVIQRSSIFSHKQSFLPLYIVTANKGETEEIPLNQSPFFNLKTTSQENIKQLFFTTIERQYTSNKTMVETQNYHWLIFSNTPRGWELVTAMTKFGYPSQQGFIVSPPQDTTNRIIGQGVNLWLRDCQSR